MKTKIFLPLLIFSLFFLIFSFNKASAGIWCSTLKDCSTCEEEKFYCEDKPGYEVYCEYVKSGEEACGLGKCTEEAVYTCGYRKISSSFTILESPEISATLQVIGNQLKISGSFSGGIYATKEACGSSGGGGGGGGGDGGAPDESTYQPLSKKFLASLNSFWERIKNLENSFKVEAASLKIFRYKFTDNCYINLAGYSAGSHRLKLILVHTPKPGGQTEKTYTFNIPSGPPPSSSWVDLKANGSDGPVEIPYNSSVTLSWTSSNVSSCVASGDWSGTKPTSGSETTANLTASALFTLTCSGGGGSVSDSVTVKVGGPPANPDLSLVHYLSNTSRGGYWGKEITAKNNDEIKFWIVVKASGNIFVKDVILKDFLPSGLVFKNGSLKIDGHYQIGDQGLFSSGLNLGTIGVGKSRMIEFIARVSSSGGTLENKVTAEGVGVPTKTASSKIIITETPTRLLSLTKTARNLTRGSDFSPFLEAYPGDLLEFKIEVANLGNVSLEDIWVVDNLINAFEYQANSLKVNGVSSSGDLFGSGLNLGNLASGGNKVITFLAKVSQSYYYEIGDNFFENVVKAKASGINPVSQPMEIKVINTTSRSLPTFVPKPKAEKSLLAYNETQKGDATLISAQENDVIIFYLLAKNSSSRALTNFEMKIDLSDLLKAGELIQKGGGELSGNYLVYSQLVIPPQETLSKEFKIKVKKASEWGEVRQLSATYGNKVVINLKKPLEKLEPELVVKKSVSNLSWPNGSPQEVSAHLNDELEFRIEIANEGKAMVGDLEVIEVLPQELVYLTSEGGEYQILTNEITWKLGSLSPQERKELVFRASLRSLPQKEFGFKEFLANLASSENLLKLFARVEAFTGYDNISLRSNPVFIKPLPLKKAFPLWKLLLYLLILVLVILIGYFLYRYFKKNRE